jgi:hypothetical protein
MPQFDKITFFTQIFWLTLIFFSFYFLILRFFLPKLAAVLKSRKKKLFLGSNMTYNLKKENLLITGKKTIFFQSFTEKTETHLSSNFLLSINWLTSCLLKSIKQQLKNSQQTYLETYGNTLVKYDASFKMLKVKVYLRGKRIIKIRD